MKSKAGLQKKLRTFFFIVVLSLVVLGPGQPALGQVSTLGDWLTGSSHTKESGTDRALIFVAHGESSSSMNLSAVTYGGQSMAKVVDYSYNAAGGYAYAAAFILDEAGITAASSGTFSPTWGGTAPGSSAYTSVFLQNVDQSDPTGASDTGGSTSNPVTTDPLATSNGDMVILAATCGNAGSYTLNNDFTEGTDQEFGGTVTGVTGQKAATGASETPSATYSSTINRQMIIGFVVQSSPVDPNKAANPNPSNGASNVSVSTGLSWDAPAAFTPTSYDVYFGVDSNAHSNPVYTVNTNSWYPPGALTEGTTYHWAVDSNDAGTMYAGDDWRFTTSGPAITWRVDARCFLDGPSGSFDDISVKDPSIVYSGGKWHLFYTGRDSSMWRMGYVSAASISELNGATRYYMGSLNGGTYFCAPQVFWFEAKGTWYLIYQSGLGATFSTNTDVNDPNGWAAGASMGFSDGIDFWCISDGTDVYCFYSAQDGSHTIKRRSTTVADFPYSWSSPDVAATDTFEAPHVYKNIADGQYYMMVEDLGRYQELWTASSLGGDWTKLEEQWAYSGQLVDNADHWTDQVSHGEILRAGIDERLEITNIDGCEVLIQGVVNGSYGDYSNIPYDLGIIRQCPAGAADLDNDCDVDFDDFAILALQWQQPPAIPSADIAPFGGDWIVDINDLASFVDSWLWGQ